MSKGVPVSASAVFSGNRVLTPMYVEVIEDTHDPDFWLILMQRDMYDSSTLRSTRVALLGLVLVVGVVVRDVAPQRESTGDKRPK
jgi:hypothetical protein